MNRAIFAALALLWTAPATAQGGDEAYRQGVAARLAGDPAKAAELLAEVTTAEPDNADAQLQLGLALLALDRLDEAEAAFRRTLTIAPDYADARIGLGRAAQRRGDFRRGLAELEPVETGNAEARLLRRQLTAASADEAEWRLDLDASHSTLTGNQPDWREGSLRLSYKASPRTTISGGAEVARRFGLTDTYGEIRIDRRFSPGASGYIFLGATPNADFRPEWQLGIGGAARVRQGRDSTVLTFDARQAEYGGGDIQTLTPGVEQYFADGRAWLSARWINIFDEDGDRHGGWLGRGDVMATPRFRLFAGAADAPDISEGIVTDTFSLFGGFAYDLTDRLAVRASLTHEDRETYDRLQFGLGAGWKF